MESFKSEFQNNESFQEELGSLYYESNEPEKALRIFEAILHKNKGSGLKTWNLLSLANLYNDSWSTELYKKAIQLLSLKQKEKFSQETNRTISKAQVQLLILQKQQGEQEDYLAQLNLIQKSDPYFLEIYYYKFLYFLSLEDQSSSQAIVKEFVQTINYLMEKNVEEVLFYD